MRGPRQATRLTIAAVGVLVGFSSLVSPAGAQVPEGGTIQPDAILQHATTSTGVGRNVYNETGADQTMRATGAAGARFAFRFRMQNDSDTVQFLTPTGCASNSNFTVKYFYKQDDDPFTPDIDVTSTITSGALSVGRNPGQSEVYRVSLRIKPGAPAGAKLTCLLSARINAKGPDDPTDVARIIVKRT